MKTLNRSTFLLLALLAASPVNAMRIKAPNIAENGSVIPVEISLDQPMTAGQHLDLLVNGDLAAQVRVVEGKLTLFSTRVKGSQNNTAIVVRVIANGREIDSASRNVAVTVGDPVRAGGPSTPSEAMRVRTQTGDIKLLMDSANGFAGTLVIQDAGFRAEISGSAVISKNPYIYVKGEFSDRVSASINGRTQKDVVAKAQEERSAQDKREPSTSGSSTSTSASAGSDIAQVCAEELNQTIRDAAEVYAKYNKGRNETLRKYYDGAFEQAASLECSPRMSTKSQDELVAERMAQLVLFKSNTLGLQPYSRMKSITEGEHNLSSAKFYLCIARARIAQCR